MGECNTIENAFTLYRHLKSYCSHPGKCDFFFKSLPQNVNVTKMIMSFFGKVENTVVKEKLLAKAIFLFPQCFLNASFPDTSKRCHCVGMG